MTNQPASTAALGFRVHSGWAVVVAIAGDVGSPAVIYRGRLEFADPEVAGSKQPYHAAAELEMKQAERLIQRCGQRSTALASKALGDCVRSLERSDVTCRAGGILLGSGRPLGTLAAILASHALIHTAEGEFFRNAVIEACKYHGLLIVTVRERELLERCRHELHLSQAALDRHLSTMGKALGPPWRQDEKLAMLVAWLALAAAGGASK